ncbi:interferon-inducible double-stranded RNA-dependent protein kinase activator A homolog [Rhynchophorus ferrugineus]|uniref:interferon-inducible double-stranded RNA-dependent protein kinase activator A homolog n=1 Tax=Rhynchophorus ferrugineus TaxID=354439 RepID=UPI003FCDD115
MEKTPISILQELMTEKRLAPPIYEIHYSGPDHSRQFHCTVTANGRSVNANGTTKKESKHNAAKNMLATIGVTAVIPAQSGLLCKVASPTHFINHVGILNEFASVNGCANPVYEDNVCIQNSGFETICHFLDFKSEGYSSNKKDAKQQSAKNMIIKLKELGMFDKKLDNRSNNKTHPSKEYTNENSLKSAMEKYTQAIKNINISERKLPVHYSTIVNENNQYSTWQDIENYLNARGYRYEISLLQQKPIMLMLRIQEAVLLATGNSVDEIKQNLAFKISKMIEINMKFTSFETS